jgi:hypothetical protein
VEVYGVEYAAAALAPLRHWPVVLAGLLGKILGPIAFLSAVVGVRFLSPFPSPSSSFGPTNQRNAASDERVNLHGTPAVNARVRSSKPLKRAGRSL